MLKDAFTSLLERDLLHFKKEIESYTHENTVWDVQEGISNSAGNLCLHICGNIQHFIGATLGNTGYVRNRDAEFTLKNIAQKKLVEELDKTITVVKATLEKLTDADFEKEFPLEVLNRKWKTAHFLVHLISHLNYHLGQVNYHRRLLTPLQ
jgi:uncharacterized damage-inducible protein DinB